ncbi:SUKH-3 domain-containing protein [Streptomyces sp. NPDC048172]|uniref:SUKH-3 domain-containing protein n=1 Tax=Streptomyces sp. NPDC048172 TaxID=3365505 RepID=UPI003724BB7B
MTTRFPVAVDDPLRTAGWQPGRWDIRQAELWADTLRGHTSPSGHRHAVFPAAVEVWAEFGGLHIAPSGPGRHIAPTSVHVDPLRGLHAARTLSAFGRALETEVCPLGAEGDGESLLVVDAAGRVYSLDPSGDWYLGPDFDTALSALLMGITPSRLVAPATDPTATSAAAPAPAPAPATGVRTE